MKESIALVNLDNTPVPKAIKGHLKITLTNAKTGEQEIIEKDNMQTDGIAEFLTNLGWMNSDNVNRSNAVKQMLGGIMLFDDEIDEDATLIKVPAGLNMIANGACDVVNGQTSGDPTEMGSWIQESDTGSGWKDDGSYHFVWEWGLDQGNGTIASACLTSKLWGHIGEGNSKSNVQKPSSVNQFDMTGSATAYQITGFPCKLNVEESTVYGIEFDTTNATATIRKYQIPLTKVNLKGTVANSVILSEATISIPQGLVNQLTTIPSNYRPTWENQLIQDTSETLVVLALNAGTSEWGDGFTQTMWEIDPEAETCTETTIPNLYSGDRTMYCMRYPVFLDKNTVVWINGNYEAYNPIIQNDKIYSMKRTSGTWGNFKSCSSSAAWGIAYYKWRGHKVFTAGSRSPYEGIIYDYDGNTAYKCNSSIYEGSGSSGLSYDKDLVYYRYQNSSVHVYRDESYMATIWNADTPYVKTAERFMRIDYEVTFEDEDEGTSTSTSS